MNEHIILNALVYFIFAVSFIFIVWFLITAYDKYRFRFDMK